VTSDTTTRRHRRHRVRRAVRGRARGRALAVLASLATIAAGLVATVPVGAASSALVVGEVYGGGGNSGAELTDDFVELRNLGTSAITLAGYSVQYLPASASPSSTWQVTPLTGSIPAGGRYLVAESAGAGGTVPLPAPDATGSIALSASAGTVALASSATALTCKTLVDCGADGRIVDLVGFGTAVVREGTAAPAATNTTSVARPAVATDTDDNAADFAAGAPTPTNAAGQTTGGGGGGEPPTGTPYAIHDIQGPGHLSTHAGETAETTGIVTAVAPKSYWIQDPAPDADQTTSEGLLVYVNAAPQVAVGDTVSVVGKVTEFRSSSATTDLHVTELTAPATTVIGHGHALPPTTLIGPGGLVPPGRTIEDTPTADVEAAGDFDPVHDGIDFYESLEGMRVTVADPQVVGPTNAFGEVSVVPARSSTRTARGGILFQPTDVNPERIVLDDLLIPALPAADVGDHFAGDVTGIMDHAFSNPTVHPTAVPTLVSGGLTREVTTKPGKDELTVATFNVENLSPTTPAAKFAALASTIVTNLAAPDVLALEEVQDNDGPTDDGVVAADVTLDTLTAAIRAAGGPTYTWKQIDPDDKTDGGEPGGNIRVAFLYRTDRGLGFVSRAGGDTHTAVGVLGSGSNTHLTVSPGRIDPANPAWSASRKPLAGEFRWRGRTVFVIANHFNSKGGDTALYGTVQPPTLSSEVQRVEQAKAVAAFVDSLYRRNPLANVVVLGDLNDFETSKPIRTLAGTVRLLDLVKTLPLDQRYTYVYQGNSQVLDHIMISPALALKVKLVKGKLVLPFAYDVVHVNSEFADQVSDHDPQVVRLFRNG
jgi:predicted extracellular nuclease